ncbi:hypothetical protein [Agrobacterium vitis]|uniref:hypothetical protein n=1 Tax=Agrobacterium vitis TaxID=373 RepID=UPI003D29E512
MADMDSKADRLTPFFPTPRAIRKAAGGNPEIEDQIWRDAKKRQAIRDQDLARPQTDLREQDTEPRGDAKRLSFGSKHRYSEGVQESFRLKALYTDETRIGPQGTAERSRNVLGFISKKKEHFLLDKVLTGDHQKDGAAYGGVEFRRSGKTESNLFRTKEVRYKADSKSYDRVSRTYLGGLVGQSFNYDAQGKKTLGGESGIGYSWSKDKEPGGLVTRTERRELFGFVGSTKRSFDGAGGRATESMLVSRNIGPYRMARTVAADGVGQIKTQQIGSGRLFSKTTHYDPTTNEKTVQTKALFGLIRRTGKPTPMSADEVAQDESWGRLQATAQTAAHDVAERRDARVKMVEAATLYALPEPGNIRRLQDRTGNQQREVSRGEAISQEKFNAIGEWVNSDGARPYASALVAAERQKQSQYRRKGQRNGRFDDNSDLSSENSDLSSSPSDAKPDRNRSGRKSAAFSSGTSVSSSDSGNSGTTTANEWESQRGKNRGDGSRKTDSTVFSDNDSQNSLSKTDKAARRGAVAKEGSDTGSSLASSMNGSSDSDMQSRRGRARTVSSEKFELPVSDTSSEASSLSDHTVSSQEFESANEMAVASSVTESSTTGSSKSYETRSRSARRSQLGD